MIKKIGRNDPCPCGSGKKYKHCCMRAVMLSDSSASQIRALLPSSSLDAPKIKKYLESNQAAPILDYLIALQMNPDNHGKNLRIEHLSQLSVAYLGKGRDLPEIEKFKALVDEEYPYDVMEDMPINMYTEKVVFFGGNYTFFPGVSTHVAELFRAMTEAIYHDTEVFSWEFCKDVYQGVSLMLELGELMAVRGNVSGMIRGCENPRESLCAPLTHHSYAITEAMMTELLQHNGFERTALAPFLLDVNDPLLLTDDAEKNPILYHPIVKYQNRYYFIGILNQGCAINNFILVTAKRHKCLQKLVDATHYGTWMRIGSSCITYLHWNNGAYSDILKSETSTFEDLFQIDVNWLAYVYYATDKAEDVSVDGNESFISKNVDAHLQSTLTVIRKDERTKDFHILTLVLYSSMGETMGLMLGDQPESDYLLTFSAYDFLQLVQTEGWDSMSLVRYARTKAAHPALSVGFNQEIDVYSLYKHYDESFYMSTDAEPNIVHIPPNDGCHLIFESKEKLNFHGTPRMTGGRVAYIPVQQNMEYANIYEPLHHRGVAKSCESYPVPVWLSCPQTEEEGLNPSSITDTVATAVTYWMEVLCPDIGEAIGHKYQKPVEIQITFDDSVLISRGLQNEEIKVGGKGTITVSKTDIGLTVHLDSDYTHSFLGSNNASEREMMKRIVMGLIDIDDTTACQIIDERIPYGQAKMILMSEVSNHPTASPLWLRPPIYIHEATHQCILEQFPLWMKEKGFDIEGKLETKAEKEGFLHSGVDVLLATMDERLAQFDTISLLRMLINNHDTLIFQREHNRMLHPAQVICFGDSEERRARFNDEERRLTDAGLATRALIEKLAAMQTSSGDARPGMDDVEMLMAIMIEVVAIGGICDAIHLGVSDHTIEKLGSGRYGIYEDEFSNHTGKYAFARNMERVDEDIEQFGDKMERLAVLRPRGESEKSKMHERIDAAFKTDWGISYSNILQFLYSCYVIAMAEQKTELELAEAELLKRIQYHCLDLTEDLSKQCLARLSLDKRGDYLTPPAGMEGKDIFPWSYNRELSYLRRPIVRYVLEGGQVMCMFAFRSCLQAGIQLTDLLYSGRLKNGGKKIGALLGDFQAIKGREFNEAVSSYLRRFPHLQVWDDVSIKQKGAFVADKDYGDIDVLAYDSARNILYSIECKNTSSAKNVKEMKTEMDEYLGRGESKEHDQKRALVLKHLRRHRWMSKHKDVVAKYLSVDSAPVVKSMMLTASVIPTSYLKQEETPLSILNFSELKRKGVAYLDSCKMPELSFEA